MLIPGLNSINFSPDSTMMSCGFADSFIEVYSVKGAKLKALKPSVELARMDLKESGMEELKDAGSESRKLIGHCGPVYSTKVRNSKFLDKRG